VADIFVSYTSSDRLKAFWIGQELKKLGHTPRIHEWEIPAGGNIPAWMEKRHHDADHVLLVMSRAYLAAPYSNWERQAAQWAAADKRPNFALPVFIENFEAPTMLAHIRRCDLFGLSETEARAALAGYLAPAAMPSTPVAFFGAPDPLAAAASGNAGAVQVQAGSYYAVSNIPITVPRHFLGRDEDMVAIDAALKNSNGRVAITALHGLRGVGKTTLAAAYAERHSGDYRATWWIRAETESTMRADLAGLGARLGWIAADEKEEPAVATVMQRLQDNGDGILLVYDNAWNASEIRPYMPQVGTAHVIVTSNAPNWGGVAAPVEIEVWPNEVGANYLVARTRRDRERTSALTLSEALGGLPLAHEQAAAYCERIGISFVEYLSRFNAAPAKLLDTEKDAPVDYHDRMTVAKTFALAIDEAAKLHPAAEPLIVYASLLAAEPIPLYLFSEAREKFGDPLTSLLVDDGLDEAVAALRAFALVDREPVPDERDSALLTDCIRLHRLVREVAAARRNGEMADCARCQLVEAMAVFYPDSVFNDPVAWPRARRLDPLAMALVAVNPNLPIGAQVAAASVLNGLACYRVGALATYAAARSLLERALAIDDKVMGPDHPDTARSLNNLGYLLQEQGDFSGAQPYYERALAIREKALGPDHTETAKSLSNLGGLLHTHGDLSGARPYFERALAIHEKAFGPDHPDTAVSLTNLGGLRQDQGDLSGARPYFERALAINEKTLGTNHPATARCLANLGGLLRRQGDLTGARPYFERALAILEKTLGPDHPDTAVSLSNLGALLFSQRKIAMARPYIQRALGIYEKAFGSAHPKTLMTARNLAGVLQALGFTQQLKALRKMYGIKN
jgi:tetratricopeptide (TPR) repeat protein